MTAETPGDRDKADAARAAAGDAEAFARLVARWQDRMLGLAWRFCRDRTMAEDMAQDAFVRAFRALPRTRSEAAFGTWLTAIALNTYRTALRDRPPVPVVPLLASHAPASAAEQIHDLERRQQAELVRAQVLRLPDRYRTAMVLLFSEDDVAETAPILGLQEGTLKGRSCTGPAVARAPPAGPRRYESVRGRASFMDELDRILAAADPLVPSAGFANRVMTAVRTAAAEEPPLPFPWARFALGLQPAWPRPCRLPGSCRLSAPKRSAKSWRECRAPMRRSWSPPSACRWRRRSGSGPELF